MNHAALRALIDSEAANGERTDSAVLAWLQEPVSRLTRVTRGDLLTVVAMHDVEALWQGAIDDATPVAGSSTMTRRSLARAALRVLDRDEGLDLADPSVAPLLDALQAAGLFTAGARAALEAAGSEIVTRAEAAGIPRPILGDVTAARDL